MQTIVLPDMDSGNGGKSTKKTRIVLIIAIVAAVILGTLLVYRIFNAGNYHTETIGQSITEIKKISEFCTANYIGEVMIQDEEKKFLSHKKIVMIVRGKIRAGFDLSQMETEIINDTTITLVLPPAHILDIITNPSDIRTFSEKGSWSHERTTITKNAARQKLWELVMEDKLLATAEENGKKQLEAIFSAFGFKQVNIQFTESPTEDNFREIVGDSVSSNATTVSTR